MPANACSIARGKPEAEIDRLKAEIFTEYLRVERPAVSTADALTAELSSFADCVSAPQRPLVDGRAALAAMQAAERVLQSVASHRWNGAAAGPVGAFVIPSASHLLTRWPCNPSNAVPTFA